MGSSIGGGGGGGGSGSGGLRSSTCRGPGDDGGRGASVGILNSARCGAGASVAQWLEHWSSKPGVGSSILPGGSLVGAS